MTHYQNLSVMAGGLIFKEVPKLTTKLTQTPVDKHDTGCRDHSYKFNTGTEPITVKGNVIYRAVIF